MTLAQDRAALVDALQLLAADAEAQVPALSAFIQLADEIRSGVADFGRVEARLREAGVLPDAAAKAIAAIDAHIDASLDDPQLWTADALRDAGVWTEIRREARKALEALGVALP